MLYVVISRMGVQVVCGCKLHVFKALLSVIQLMHVSALDHLQPLLSIIQYISLHSFSSSLCYVYSSICFCNLSISFSPCYLCQINTSFCVGSFAALTICNAIHLCVVLGMCITFACMSYADQVNWIDCCIPLASTF